MTQPFTPGHPTTAVLVAWRHGLESNRADRAELRRCGTLLQVVQTRAFQSARQLMIAAGLTEGESRHPRLAAIIALAAQVRKPVSDQSLPQAFSNGDKPAVSPLRFRQILEAGDDEELFARLRRVLPLIESEVSLPRLAGNVWYWGDAVRKRWVYDYRWPTKQPA